MNKDDKIKKLQIKIAKIDQHKKLKNSYVVENLNKFEELIAKIQTFKNKKGLTRYFHTRTARQGTKNEGDQEMVFKLNLLIEDLLEFKAREHLKLHNDKQCDLKVLKNRFSMDVGSLISHLEKARIKRPHKN